MAGDPERVLILAPGWVGDAVMATPAMGALRERYPKAVIFLCAKPYLIKIFRGSPWFQELIPNEAKQIGLGPMSKKLKALNFDMALCFPNSFSSAWLLWLAGIPCRIGYGRNLRSWLLTDRLSSPQENGKWKPRHMVQYYNDMAERAGAGNFVKQPVLHTTKEQEENISRLWKELMLDSSRTTVALNPGAKYGDAKQWLDSHFAKVGDALAEQWKAQVLILCGPGEEPVAQSISNMMRSEARVISPARMPLDLLKALMPRLDLLVTNDTGIRQYAEAFGVPVVTVYGPTHKAWSASGAATSLDLQIPLDCGPCMERTCPLGHHKCMVDLKPEQVLEASNYLLNKFGKERKWGHEGRTGQTN